MQDTDEGVAREIDVAIIGAGPTGLFAAYYAGFRGLSVGVIDTLPEREALIVRMRFGLYDGRPHTLDEIGRHVGLTRERIRQLEKSALAQLREPEARAQLLDLAS